MTYCGDVLRGFGGSPPLSQEPEYWGGPLLYGCGGGAPTAPGVTPAAPGGGRMAAFAPEIRAVGPQTSES